MICTGLLILTAALLLILYNIYLDKKAMESTLEAVSVIETGIPDETEKIETLEILLHQVIQILRKLPKIPQKVMSRLK